MIRTSIFNNTYTNKAFKGFICLSVLSVTSFVVIAQDRFAQIGGREYQTREHLLVTPPAPELQEIYLPTAHNQASAFKPMDVVDTKEELYRELDSLRSYYRPFLSLQAPAFDDRREQIPLPNFDWRIAEDVDLSDINRVFSGEGTWENVNIPHYGPPLGRAVTYYRKEVEMSQEMLEGKQLFICFKGVDYRAKVFVNGNFAGMHEGFFAPFEFDITKFASAGKNVLVVQVENDFSTTGMTDQFGNKILGGKIYAATGPGYDDPKLGWHHGAAAMGIYQDCYLEIRSPLHLNDLFVRPILKDPVAELWVEVNNFHERSQYVKLQVSIFGQNFEQTLIKDFEYEPSTVNVPGVGDLAKPKDWEQLKLSMDYGVNYLRIPLKLDNPRVWEQISPWLYQVQVKLLDESSAIVDIQSQQFGMRSFEMDTTSVPKGRMYLNGKMIRLRGANTMGHFQQCVMKKDWNQLVDDILLAKLANMNYIRLTQRPVQEEIYTYMDRLGMLNQADFPLFGTMRRNKVAEALKQVEEMERLVRPHPSTIMISYINERFPNAEGHPQRSLNSPAQFERFFTAMDQMVLLTNPDRIIKAGDGDYDPPSPGLPDNHCYNMWYNGHALDLGDMYKGQWQPVKPNWYYACGEFGAEGLDPLNVMQKYYPEGWLPEDLNDPTWNANRIAKAQTNKFHYMWFNTQNTVEKWIEASQDYQATAIKMMTETFRRDSRMMSFAVHLFIDAWPAGWMKTLMDVDRQPKKAYFEYRNALEPTIVTIRSDRNKFFEGEQASFELWISNDLDEELKSYKLAYQIEKGDEIIFSQSVNANIPVNSSAFQGFVPFNTPKTGERTKYLVRTAVVDEQGNHVHQNTFDFETFPMTKATANQVYALGDHAESLLEAIGIEKVTKLAEAQTILVTDFDEFKKKERSLRSQAKNGKTIVLLNLPAGNREIFGSQLTIDNTKMGQYYFASPTTGHALISEAEPFDFRFWYHEKTDRIAPILKTTVLADEDWDVILGTGLTDWGKDKGPALAAGEMQYGKGTVRFSQVILDHRLKTNPTARQYLLSLVTPIKYK